MIAKVTPAVAVFLLFVVLFTASTTASIVAALGGSGFRAVDGSGPSNIYAGNCAPISSAAASLPGHSQEQIANAATIVAVGKRLNIPTLGIVTALAAAMQESGLRNLGYGDRDSLGLFQQRPSQGWGTPAQVTNPTHAATVFYRHLLTIPNWQYMSVNDLAQAVQRSAFPSAYGPHEQAARALAAAVAGATCAADQPGPPSPAAPTQAVQQAVAFARAQIGQPYVWGGNGAAQSGGFDCSGLTAAAYRAAGVSIPRTAQTQYNAGPLLPAHTPVLPGDLIFFGTPGHVHHVAIATGNGTQIIHAPDVGQTVRLDDWRRFPDLLAASRPSAGAAASVSAQR